MEGEDSYVIDGAVKKLVKHVEIIRVLQSDGTHTEEPLEIRRSVHGPVVHHNFVPPFQIELTAVCLNLCR